MYTKPGYTLLRSGDYLPRMAALAIDTLGDGLETEIGLALKQVGPERSFLSGLIVDDLLRIASPRIVPGNDVYEGILTIAIGVLNHAGFLSEDVEYIDYVDDPLLHIDKVVSRMIGERIPWNTKVEFGGEKATLLSLKTLLPIAIREMRGVERLRKEYYTYLSLALGNIGYKILQGQPIDQSEKTFFISYANTEEDAPGEELGLSEGKNVARMNIPATQDANPLTLQAFTLAKQVTEMGPGTRFYRLVSNTNLESLLYYYGPHAATLPLTTGYMRPVGPFNRLRLKRLEEKRWTEQDIINGIRDRFLELPTRAETAAKPDIGGPRSMNAQAVEWVMNAPIKVCGPDKLPCAKSFIDLPAVRLRIIDESNCGKFTWEYPSSWRQRIIMSNAGGNPDMMFTDFAALNATAFEALVDHLNIDEFKLVKMTDRVKNRSISMDTRGTINEQISYVRRSGEITTLPVDMTDFYSRGGVVQYRPAFAEYFMPPRSWYFVEDPQATAYIAARLGLTRDEIQRNALPLTLSHNDAVIRRITGAEPPFSIEGMVRVALNARST